MGHKRGGGGGKQKSLVKGSGPFGLGFGQKEGDIGGLGVGLVKISRRISPRRADGGKEAPSSIVAETKNDSNLTPTKKIRTKRRQSQEVPNHRL